MSAVAPSIERAAPSSAARAELPAVARPFLFLLLGVAGAAAVAAFALPGANLHWSTFAALVLGGAVAQAFAVHMPANQVFHTGIAFTVAAALVLPPKAFVIVCLAQHIPEWVRQRHPWYIQSFNIANCTVGGFAALAIRAGAESAGVEVGIGAAGVAVAAGAAAAFVLVNHALLARMLRVARGHEVKATRLFTVDALTTDLVLAAVGIATAIALRHDPAAVPVVLFPLVVIHRALVLPTLRAQALRDHKTGLLNSRAIAEHGQRELERAQRFDRPLSLLVVDVDGLREINNRFGHLVGDSVLVALADAFRGGLRDFDICARFGGDEFLVLLPETRAEEASAIARRIRERVAESRLPSADGPGSFGVSVGVAERRLGDQRLEDLIERADAEMYDAKYGAAEPA
jgi:diguanylate cyclase (GGDEF)-like protein